MNLTNAQNKTSGLPDFSFKAVFLNTCSIRKVENKCSEEVSEATPGQEQENGRKKALNNWE